MKTKEEIKKRISFLEQQIEGYQKNNTDKLYAPCFFQFINLFITEIDILKWVLEEK